jgi:hypothetical protein
MSRVVRSRRIYEAAPTRVHPAQSETVEVLPAFKGKQALPTSSQRFLQIGIIRVESRASYFAVEEPETVGEGSEIPLALGALLGNLGTSVR